MEIGSGKTYFFLTPRRPALNRSGDSVNARCTESCKLVFLVHLKAWTKKFWVREARRAYTLYIVL